MQYQVTAKQQQLLNYLRFYISAHGISPSYEEMRKHLEISSGSGVHRLVSALEERGHIRKLKDRARSITLVGS